MKKDECTPKGVIGPNTIPCWKRKIDEIMNIQSALGFMTENIRNLKRAMKSYGIDRMKDYDDFIKFLKYNNKELEKHKKTIEKKILKAQECCEHEWEVYYGGLYICRKCGKVIADIETSGMDIKIR